MRKVNRPQGKTTNKVVITFKDYSPQTFGTMRESFKCSSIDAAKKIVFKRDARRIFFYDFFDNKGNKTRTNVNNNDTILSI